MFGLFVNVAGDAARQIADAQRVNGVQAVGRGHGDQARAVRAAVHGQAGGTTATLKSGAGFTHETESR